MVEELRYVLADPDELAQVHELHLRHGRALVPCLTELARLDPVVLVLERGWDGAFLRIEARVVMILPDGPMRGTALELDASVEVRARVASFVAGEHRGDVGASPIDDDLARATPVDAFADLPALEPFDHDPPEGASEEEPDGAEEEPADPETAHGDPKIVRIRKLSLAERRKVAQSGALEDRVMLERVFGKSVWEDLLSNSGISLPEVARIANKGTAPRVLLDQIVDHGAWSRQALVRRALLSNPRLSPDAIPKLLRGVPKPELKAIVASSSYPIAVRTVAKKLLDA